MEYKGYRIWNDDINLGWKYVVRVVATKPGCDTLTASAGDGTREGAIRVIKRHIDNQEVGDE